MALKKKPSLTDILAQFRSQQKLAEDGMLPEEVVPVDAAAAEAAAVDQGGTTSDDVAAAAQNVENAEAGVIDAKETLQAVTDEFINEHTAALKKEAQIFGELFAASCIQHMNKTASLMDVEQATYEHTLGVLQQDILQKCAAVYDDAYMVTLAALSGFDSVEAFQKTAGIEDLSPEEVAELIASSEAPAEEGLSEEDLAALAEQMAADEAPAEEVDNPVAEALETAADAAESNADAIQAIAEAAQLLSGVAGGEGVPSEDGPSEDELLAAANLLAEEGQEEDPEAAIADNYVDENGDVNLPGIEEQAYANALAQLGQG